MSVKFYKVIFTKKDSDLFLNGNNHFGDGVFYVDRLICRKILPSTFDSMTFAGNGANSRESIDEKDFFLIRRWRWTTHSAKGECPVNRALLSLLVFILNLNMVFPFSGYNEIAPVINGKTYLNLNKKEFIGEMVPSKFTLKNLIVNNNFIRIKGSVEFNGGTEKVNLQGQLKRSPVVADIVTATLIDQSGNFEVVHFSLSGVNEQNGLFNQLQNGKVLRMYLFKPEMRALSIFEGKFRAFGRYTQKLEWILQNKHVFHQAEFFGTDYWQPLVFEPIDSGITIIEEPTIRRDEFSIFEEHIVYVSRRKKIFKYWETYPASPFCNLTYWIEGTVKAVVSDGKGGVALDLTDKYTTSNCPFYQNDDSPFGIGLFDDPVQMSVVTNGYDSFVEMSMTGTNEKAQEGSFTVVKFGVGVSYRGINLDTSMDLAYTESSKLDHFPRSLSVHEEADEDQWPHKIQGKFSNVMLTEEGSQLYLTGSIRTDHDDQSMKYVHARTRFVISARYDGNYTWRHAAMPDDREFNLFVWDYRS